MARKRLPAKKGTRTLTDTSLRLTCTKCGYKGKAGMFGSDYRKPPICGACVAQSLRDGKKMSPGWVVPEGDGNLRRETK